MSPQKPETDPRALAHRAAEEFATGGYLAAQTAALVATALALTPIAGPAVSDEPAKPRTVVIAFRIGSGEPISVHVDAQSAYRATKGREGIGFAEWPVLPR